MNHSDFPPVGCGVLPRRARMALIAAAASHPDDPRARAQKIDEVIDTIQLHYPEYFNPKENLQ